MPDGEFHQTGEIVDVKLTHQAAAIGCNCFYGKREALGYLGV